MGEWERMSECECEKYRNKTWELKHWNEYGAWKNGKKTGVNKEKERGRI